MSDHTDAWVDGECSRCAAGDHANCLDDGAYNSPWACECARETHGESGIGVIQR